MAFPKGVAAREIEALRARRSARFAGLSPGTADPPDAGELTLDADRAGRVRLTAGQAATLVVEAGEPGQVEIPELGLAGFAEPLTPARFELFASDARPAGTLVVHAADA